MTTTRSQCPTFPEVSPATDCSPVAVDTPKLVDAALGPARSVWWVNVALLARLRRDGVDAFFGPNFVQPVGFLGPSVVVVHDMVHRVIPESHPRTHRWYLRAFLPLSLWRADRVVTVSESTRRDLERLHGVDPDRVTVAPGAAADRFRPRSVEASTEERLRREYDLPERFLLYVGNIEPRKNLATLLSALERFDDEDRPPLVVVGARHVADEALDRAYRECSFRSAVRFTGYVPDKDLPLLYALATALVYPSLYEGFGLPVLEAMQSGLPVVTGNRSSLSEVAGDAAVTVDIPDPAEPARGIRILWSCADARARARERGLERAREFSWHRTAEIIATVLSDVVDTVLSPCSRPH
jgi:glycosyltransferase involved in cell wall biosynthesis